MSNSNMAPYPEALAAIINATTYKEGWTFSLADLDRGQDSIGLTLIIKIICPNSYNPAEMRPVHHFFPVPPAAYNTQSWARWLFNQILHVERHEAMEFFQVEGVRLYAPNHSPGHDPYQIRELTTEEERRTSFRGELNPHDTRGR